jgi:hypothetical protein
MTERPPKRPAPLVSRRSALLVFCAFVCARVLYFAAGIRFDLSPVANHWQLIDPELMRTDLLRSLFYLHMQPPGFNLLVGSIVKLAQPAYGIGLYLVYLAAGLSIAMLLLWLMRMLGVAPAISTALAIVFVVSPGCVLFENIVAYEYPVLLLLLAAAVCFLRLHESPSRARALAFFACLFGLLMIRNQFHLIYFLAITAMVLWTLPAARREVLTGATAFLVPILALHFKNWMLFGTFSLSTWAGMATGVVTTFQLTPAETDMLIQRGVVSPLARIPPFSPLAEYRGIVQVPPKTGIPVLDEEITSTGHPNFNNPAYLQLHSLYQANSKAVLLHCPVAYLRSQAIAWFAYFLPSSEMHYFDRQREKIAGFERAFNMVCFGQLRHAASRKDLRSLKAGGNALVLVLYTGIFLMILLPLLVIWGGVQLLPSRSSHWQRPELATLGFILFTIVFVTGVSNTLSTFESNRYRFPLDGFYVVLSGLVLTRFMARRPAHESDLVSAPVKTGR